MGFIHRKYGKQEPWIPEFLLRTVHVVKEQMVNSKNLGFENSFLNLKHRFT